MLSVFKWVVLIIVIIVLGFFVFKKEEVKPYIITEEGGGSGTFYYVTTNIEGTKPFFIGDRIVPQTIEKHDNLIFVNYLDRNPDEPFTTPPSVKKTLRLRFDMKTKEFDEVK